jgi:hypothetical protein
MLLVGPIEWTSVVEADTYDTALEHASVILRNLLGTRLLGFLVALPAWRISSRTRVYAGTVVPEFSWENGRRLKEHLATVRTAVLARLTAGPSFACCPHHRSPETFTGSPQSCR